LKARLADLGAIVLPGSRADYGKAIADETEKWAKVNPSREHQTGVRLRGPVRVKSAVSIYWPVWQEYPNDRNCRPAKMASPIGHNPPPSPFRAHRNHYSFVAEPPSRPAVVQ
jgi:hypothetical protein